MMHRSVPVYIPLNSMGVVKRFRILLPWGHSHMVRILVQGFGAVVDQSLVVVAAVVVAGAAGWGLVALDTPFPPFQSLSSSSSQRGFCGRSHETGCRSIRRTLWVGL
jgi:hypothetical protein